MNYYTATRSRADERRAAAGGQTPTEKALRSIGQEPEQIRKKRLSWHGYPWQVIKRGLQTGQSLTGALLEPMAEAERQGLRGLPLAKEMASSLLPWKALPRMGRGIAAAAKGQPYSPGEMMARGLEAERGERLSPKRRFAVGLAGDILGDPLSYFFPVVKGVALAKEAGTMAGILGRAERGAKLAEGISEVARKAAPRLVAQTVKYERVPERLIRRVATTLDDESYLRQVGKEALDFAAGAPRTGVRWGIGKASIEAISPEEVARAKAGLGRVGRFVGERVPALKTIPKVFGQRYLEEATLAPGARKNVGELVAGFRTQRQGQLNWVSRMTQLFVKENRLTPQENDLLTTLHARLQMPETVIDDLVAKLPNLKGPQAAMQVKRIEGWRDIFSRPAEAIIEGLAPDRQAVLMKLANRELPKIYKGLYIADAVPKEAARLTIILDKTRRLLGQTDDLAAREQILVDARKAMRLERPAEAVLQAVPELPSSMRRFVPERISLDPSLRGIERLATSSLSAVRSEIGKIGRANIKEFKPGWKEAYMPGIAEQKVIARTSGRLGEAHPFYTMAKSFRHPIERAWAAEGMEEMASGKLQAAEQAIAAARASAVTKPEVLEAALRARGAAQQELKMVRQLKPQEDAIKGLYTRMSSQVVGNLRKGLMAELRRYAKPANEVRNIPGWVGTSWDEFKGSRLRLPQEIVEAVEKMINPARREGALGDLGRLFHGYTQWWKATATAIWPRWLSLNFIGNKVNNWLGGLSNPNRYFESWVMNMRRAAPDTETGALVQRLIPDTGRIGQFKRALVSKIFKDGYETKLYGRLTVDKVVREAERAGALTGFTGAEYGLRQRKRIFDLKSWLSVDAPYFRPGMKVNEVFEETDKLALFLDRLKKGDTFEAAGRHVKKFLFDYSDLTPTEQAVFKNVAPFFTWLRKNFQLQMQTLIEQPGKSAAFVKGRAAAERAGEPQIAPEDMPEWFESAQATRVPTKGEPRYILSRTPPQELAGYLDPRQMIGSLHPLIQTVIAAGTGRDPYSGRRVSLKDILMNLTPLTSTYGRMFQQPIEQGLPEEERTRKQREQMIGMLTGYRPYRLDLERAAEATRLREQALLSTKARELRGKGVLPVSPQGKAAQKRMRKQALKKYPPWALPP